MKIVLKDVFINASRLVRLDMDRCESHVHLINSRKTVNLYVNNALNA